MKLDASSHATLVDVKRGGVAVKACDSLTLYGTTGGGGFVYCTVGVAWEVWSRVMSVILVEACQVWGGRDQIVERISQKACRSNVMSSRRESHEMFNQASPVQGTSI